MLKESVVLDPAWQFKEFPESARRIRDLDAGHWLDAVVPSSIYTCLEKAGLFSLADWSNQSCGSNWPDIKNWIFRKQFDVPPSLLEKERIEFVFEGLDTVAHIWLNDKLIGKTENMFIPHRFDIKLYLKQSSNTLYVKLISPLQHAGRLLHRYGTLGQSHLRRPESAYIRKSAYQFGSVFGPSLTGCGIVRPVRLEGSNIAAIENLHLRTIDCSQYDADIHVAVLVNQINHYDSPLQCRVTLSGGGLNLTQQLPLNENETSGSTVLHIERPFLWWPHGYGISCLYHIRADLLTENGQLLDSVEQDFGVRNLRIEPALEQPRFLVNGQHVHTKAADWLPVSMFPGTATPTDYEHLLKQAKECHINLLRVRADGFYEDSAFYQLCDRMGILVWQDFMFDNAYYPDRRWFLDIVEREARTVIKQLRNHACLALWCGNNNINRLHETHRLGNGRKFYGKPIFHKLLLELVHELDPDRLYIPTHSRHNDENQTLIANIPDIPSPPALESLPESRNSFRIVEKLSHSRDDLSKIAQSQLYDFLPPKTSEEYIWQSQVVQARWVKNAVEGFRIFDHFGGNCMLGLLNDYVLRISPSMLDFHKRPKALYYYAKHFFAAVLVAAFPDEATGELKAHIVNDSPSPVTGMLSCRLLDVEGNLLDFSEIPVSVSPFSKLTPRKLPHSLSRWQDPARSFLSVRLKNNEKLLAENTFFYYPDKEFNWPGVNIDIQVDTESDKPVWNVTLFSKTLVRDLQITPPRSANLSDNFLTLLPNETKNIQMTFDDTTPSIHTPIKLFSTNQSLNPS